MPHYDYDKDYPFAAFITNLGKYNEGALVGEWVKFPTTAEELKKVFERIGIGAKDDFGQTYEEWFITDYDCYVDGLYDLLGEYANLDELNYLASKLDDMSQDEYERFQAAMEIGDHTGSIQELMSREQMEAAGYGFHHESEDGKYLIMANGSRAFAIPSGDAPEHTAPEKLTVLVVEPMKEPYVKEIDPGLHALQAEVGGDIAASYPFDDPVGLVLNDEGKLIGLDLNRSLRDEHGEIYDIVAGTFLVVGLGPESFASLPPDMIQKYTEQFKRPELFASINGQIVSVPVEPENPLRTAEMTLEDDYGMIDGIINNGRRGEELEKAQTEARRTTPEKKPSIRERLEDAKRECAERKSPDKPAPQKKPPELGDL